MESKAKVLGHPIHPMLIVFPLGLLATAVAFGQSIHASLPVTSSALKCFEQAEADGLADADATTVPVHWVKQQTRKGANA